MTITTSCISVLQAYGIYRVVPFGPLSTWACIRSQSIVKQGLGSTTLSGTWEVDYSGRMSSRTARGPGLLVFTRSSPLPFDSAYCIDRNLGSALGRPPGIPDDWVDADVSTFFTVTLRLAITIFSLTQGPRTIVWPVIHQRPSDTCSCPSSSKISISCNTLSSPNKSVVKSYLCINTSNFAGFNPKYRSGCIQMVRLGSSHLLRAGSMRCKVDLVSGGANATMIR